MVSSEFLTFYTPDIPLNITLESQKLHNGQNSVFPTYPANLVFLSAIRANWQGVVSPWPSAL